MATDTPAPTKKAATLAEVLNGSTQRLADVLPAHIRPERVIRMALMAAHKNPAILRCSQESVVFSVVQIAAWGLEIGRTAHLVPYGDKCQPIPDYKGIVQMMIQSGEVMRADARVVREGDEFDFEYGLDERLVHKPILGNAGEVTFAYAILTMPDGGKKFEVMSRKELEAVRAKSKASSNGPWADPVGYPEMCKKTVIKRISKMVPMSERLQDVIEADNAEYQSDGAQTQGSGAKPPRGQSRRLAALAPREPEADPTGDGEGGAS